MDIYAFDAFCPKEVIEKDGVKAVASAEELYSACDIVSLHIPATAETKNSINYALVGRMPKGGLLVNTARKEVINEAELIQLMEERADLKYMTDIMPAANDTFAAKFAGRYFSTPKKMGAQTAEANINAGIAAARQILEQAGAAIRNIYFDSASYYGKLALGIIAFPTTCVLYRQCNIVGEPIMGGIDKEDNAATLQKLIDEALAQSQQ